MPADLHLHPALLQSALELRARLRRWRRRPGESLFHLLALIGLTGLALLFLRSLAPRLTPVFEVWQARPLPALGLLLVAAAAWAHRRAVRFGAAAHRLGWLATLPITAALQRRGLAQHLLLGLLGGALWTAAVALSAWALGLVGAADAFVLSQHVMAALLVASAGVFLLRAHRLAPVLAPAGRTRGVAAAPWLPSQTRGWALPPPWLGPWPELGQLQRRQAQRSWRSGRAWVWLLPLGLMVLAGEGARVFAGMLLLVVMLPWLRTTLDASARALAEAERVLLATPRARKDFCRSGWRYPASRALLAGAAFALALGLFGAPPPVLMFGALAFLLVCGLEIALMLHYPRSRARQRGQLMAEIALLLMLAREGLGPAVLLPAMGLMTWHAWRAGRLA